MKNKYNQILEEMTKYDKLFEIIRIVNPKRKEVMVYSENVWKIEEEPCYHFWESGDACINCTSMRAITLQKNVMKIKYSGDKIYAVTSVPTQIEGDPVVLELICDTTQSADLVDETINEMKAIIEKTNEMVVRDGLTGLYNRKFIDERLPYQIESSFKRDKSSFIIMGDIDHFKNVNDTFGHQAGDHVIKTLAGIFVSSIRKNDWAARYGGEEFVIFLSELAFEDALQIIERIRVKIENTDFKSGDSSFSVTSSFGLSEIVFGETPESILKKADQLLYRAKTDGRNMVKH